MTRQLTNILGPHRKSLYLVLICLVVLGVFLTVTVIKDIGTRRRLEERISDGARQAERNVLLSPLMAELQNNDTTAVPGDADNADLGLLIESSAEDYQTVIGMLIDQCDLGPASLTPDLQSILSDTGYILVDLTARGTFSNFRRLILQLGRLPFLSGVDRFSIQPTPDAAGLELFLRLRIQVDSPTDDTDGNE